MIKCFEANYPESLGVCLIHKAPWIFQGIWKIIRGWLDPVVAAKVHFTNSLTELESYVDKSSIVKELGGDNPYEYEFIEPVEGENKKLEDTAKREELEAARAELVAKYEELTAEWIAGSSPDALAAVQSKRSEVAQQLKESYWELDPYVRARTFYDRVGVLAPDGKVDWSKVVGRKSASLAGADVSKASKSTSVAGSGDGAFETPKEEVTEKVALNGTASTAAAGVEDKLADKAALPNAAPPGEGAAAVAAGSEKKIDDAAANGSTNGPTPARHEPEGLD